MKNVITTGKSTCSFQHENIEWFLNNTEHGIIPLGVRTNITQLLIRHSDIEALFA